VAAIYGVDYSFDRPSPVYLAAHGWHFACRYIGPGSGKLLTGAEADALRAAGLSIVFLVEGYARDALLGYAKGREHAESAAYHIRSHNWPRDRPMYFAVDFDMTVAQRPAVKAYLQGAASVVGVDRVGVYGGIRTTEWAWQNRLSNWLFQTYAWSNGVWGDHAYLQQFDNGRYVGGAQVDLCRAMVTDWGQWPHATETIGKAPVQPAPVVTSGPWDYTPEMSGVTSDLVNSAYRIAGYTRLHDNLRK
jgi:hypothetical protein